MDTVQLLGSTMGLGFVAGFRLYATVLALGLGIRFGWLQLAPGYEEHLTVLTNPIVLAIAGTAYIAEFFADKVPWVDTIWDAFHTFIRPIGAAALAATVLGSLDPSLKLAMIILCGGVAFTSHSSKAGVRLLVNHSPEPFSNVGLSLAEDVFAPVGVWLSLKHPTLVMVAVLCFLAVFAWLSPKIFRLMRLQLIALWALVTRGTKSQFGVPQTNAAQSRPEIARVISIIARNAGPIPNQHARTIVQYLPGSKMPLGVRCAATRRIKGLRNSIGFLIVTDEHVLFVARRFFKYRIHVLQATAIQSAELKRGLLMNRLIFRTPSGDNAFFIFKDVDVSEYPVTSSVGKRTATA